MKGQRKLVIADVEQIGIFLVPITPSQDIAIKGEFPISEAEWAQFMAVLNAMKPGLVRDDPDQEAPA